MADKPVAEGVTRSRRPATRSKEPRQADRTTDDRLADHAQIERLTDDLLPALAAKLGASGLAEIEVREGPWKVRLRRPPGANGSTQGRRSTDRPSRAQPGHSEHGHAPVALESHRGSVGWDGLGLTPVGPGRPAGASGGDGRSHRAIATSPAVGIFQGRPEMRPGTKVRAGDRLGFVDVLGVRQEVISPVDGLVGATLVDPGDAVEYGQELVRIELAASPSASATAVSGASMSSGAATSSAATSSSAATPSSAATSGASAPETAS